MAESICKQCGTTYKTSSRARQYCSKGCAAQAQRADPTNTMDSVVYKKLRSYKVEATKRSLAWELTDEEAVALFLGDCWLCGEPEADGIDRMNNHQGYTVRNSAPCCLPCNALKGNDNLVAFLQRVKKIARHAEAHGYYLFESLDMLGVLPK